MPDEIEQHYTVDELAQILHLTPRGVQEMCKTKKIRSVRPGRAYLIPGSAIEEYLKGGENG